MKTKISFLLIFSFWLFQVQAENDCQITDSLFMGYYVEKVIWDSEDTLWFTPHDNTSCLGKAYGDSVWLYDSNSSGLNATVCDIAIDTNDTIWLATGGGLTKYDHHTFTTYDTTNSDIPTQMLVKLLVDRDNTIWAEGIVYSDNGAIDGIVKYNKKNWFHYTSENSLLSSSLVYSINSMIIDNCNNIWIACGSQYADNSFLILIKDSLWTLYNGDSIGIPMNSLSVLGHNLEVDNENNIYVNMYKNNSIDDGNPTIIKYNGASWQVIDTTYNYGKRPISLACDNNGTLWTSSGGYNDIRYYSEGLWIQWPYFQSDVSVLFI